MRKGFTVIEVAIVVVIALALLVSVAGFFGSNTAARRWGGSTTVTLPPGQKLVNVTWKESSIWYLTRPRHQNEPVETWTFKEDSTFGLMEGNVTIKEQN